MTTNYAHSIKTKLLNLSRQERIQYQQLLTRYFHERLLFRLSISDYRSRFILKGGALLYAYEQFAARPTLDIDFMGTINPLIFCITTQYQRVYYFYNKSN
jgi:hypothetical protein